MSQFVAALHEEIRRLARKEVRALTSVTRRAASQHRREIAALKRQLRQLSRQLSALETLGRKQVLTAPAAELVDGKARFSPGWIKVRRTRLKLSAQEYGKLIGVSGQTIYKWELGKGRPRAGALARLLAVKGIGRREARLRLEMLAGNKKAPAAKRGRKATNVRRKARK